MKPKFKKNSIMFEDIKLDVPYFSQYKEVEGKENCLKACGMTCVYSVLKYHEIQIPSLNEMVIQGIQNSGLDLSGWKHDYFVDLFTSFGFLSERKESMRDTDVEIIKQNILDGYPVIISAERKLFDKRIFHMVVITGIRQSTNGNLEGFFYNDPASLQDEFGKCYVPLQTFLLSWRRMAIFAKTNNS